MAKINVGDWLTYVGQSHLECTPLRGLTEGKKYKVTGIDRGNLHCPTTMVIVTTDLGRECMLYAYRFEKPQPTA